MTTTNDNNHRTITNTKMVSAYKHVFISLIRVSFILNENRVLLAWICTTKDAQQPNNTRKIILKMSKLERKPPRLLHILYIMSSKNLDHRLMFNEIVCVCAWIRVIFTSWYSYISYMAYELAILLSSSKVILRRQ